MFVQPCWATELEIYEITAHPNPFTPDWDGIDDYVYITAWASKRVNWTSQITDFNGDLGSMGWTGDPSDQDTEVIEFIWQGFMPSLYADTTRPGIYTYTVFAEDGEGNKVSKSIEIELAETGVSKPKILDFSVSPTTFTPNDDGVDDVVKIRATLSEEAKYGICIIVQDGGCMGGGDGTARIIEAEWNGISFPRDENGIPGNPTRVTGTYPIILKVYNENHEQTDNRSIEVELSLPTTTPAPTTTDYIDITPEPGYPVETLNPTSTSPAETTPPPLETEAPAITTPATTNPPEVQPSPTPDPALEELKKQMQNQTKELEEHKKALEEQEEELERQKKELEKQKSMLESIAEMLEKILKLFRF